MRNLVIVATVMKSPPGANFLIGWLISWRADNVTFPVRPDVTYKLKSSLEVT
jgi:hypothetical protein